MSTCWFCQKQESEANSKLVINFYKELTRTRKKVTYQTSSITIDRCPTCKAAMQKSKTLGVVLFALSVITVFMSCAVLQMATNYNFSDGTVTILLILIGFFALGFGVLAFYLPARFHAKAGIRPELNPLRPAVSHPSFISLVKEGWKTGKKPTS